MHKRGPSPFKRLVSRLSAHEGLVRYGSNTVWLMLEKGIRLILGVTIFAWVIRYLGPTNFGNLGYAQSLVGIFGGLSFFGINVILPRELLRKPKERGTILGSTSVLGLAGAFVALLLLLLSFLFLDNTDEQTLFILIISPTLFFNPVLVIQSYFQSRALSKYVVWSNLVALGLCSAMRVCLILWQAPTVYFVVVMVLDAFLAMALCFCFYCKKGLVPIKKWGLDASVAKKLLRYGSPYLFVNIAASVAVRIDQVMLKEMLSAAANGYYAAAVRIAEPCFVIPGIIVSSLLPAIINAKNGTNGVYKFRVQRLYDLSILTTLLLCAPIVIFAGDIIGLLYGPRFEQSTHILSVCIFNGILVGIVHVRSAWILTENLQRYEVFIHLVGIALNISLNYFFIRAYGTIGAAYGTLGAYILAFVTTSLAIKNLRPSLFMVLASFYNIATLQFFRRGYFRGSFSSLS